MASRLTGQADHHNYDLLDWTFNFPLGHVTRHVRVLG